MHLWDGPWPENYAALGWGLGCDSLSLSLSLFLPHIHKFHISNEIGNLSEGVPHEVFGPWVRWEEGQVIPDLSRCSVATSSSGVPPTTKKHWETWTKNVKTYLKMTLFRGLVFPEIVFFFWKKKINGNTGGTGLKKRSLSPHLQENLFFWCW